MRDLGQHWTGVSWVFEPSSV